MSLKAAFFKRTFTFRFNARTSRGDMKQKTSWFVKIWEHHNPEVTGVGECGPLPGLSPDYIDDFEAVLLHVIDHVSGLHVIEEIRQDVLGTVNRIVPKGYPSIRFGLETALLDLIHGGKRVLFENDFVHGTPIPINGLIWMGDPAFMKQQIDRKLTEGYTCIKLKVGALDFEKECKLLEYIRREFSNDVALRLDANGAFHPDEVLHKMDVLSKYTIHSIEQPLKARTMEMADVCRRSPIPVALDEELIGIDDNKQDVLETIRPSFIVLKPTLHGGIQGCMEWIDIAERLQIGWWITSALESNIGLNAICQFTANYPIHLPQGLGTGMLYENNFDSPLTVEKGKIFYDLHKAWNPKEV